jgi:hypothetical protein
MQHKQTSQPQQQEETAVNCFICKEAIKKDKPSLEAGEVNCCAKCFNNL